MPKRKQKNNQLSRYGELWQAFRDAFPEASHTWVDQESSKTWALVKKDDSAYVQKLAELKEKAAGQKRKRLAFWTQRKPLKKPKKEALPKPELSKKETLPKPKLSKKKTLPKPSLSEQKEVSQVFQKPVVHETSPEEAKEKPDSKEVKSEKAQKLTPKEGKKEKLLRVIFSKPLFLSRAFGSSTEREKKYRGTRDPTD